MTESEGRLRKREKGVFDKWLMRRVDTGRGRSQVCGMDERGREVMGVLGGKKVAV